MKTAALFLILIVFLMPNIARAEERLRFKAAENYKDRQIVSFVQKLAESPSVIYALAHTDLNNDAIDEYIVKPAQSSDCPDKPLCPYAVIAFQDRKPILLGQFDAHKMLISNKKTYGVRGIIVYNNHHNDYQSKTASWSPHSFQFEILE